MPPKKRTNSTIEPTASGKKIWKANPPGQEQLELNRLFENGTVDRTDTPNNVRLRHPMFQAFPSRTFALHFRTTKAKLGFNSLAVNQPTENEEDIPELFGTAAEPHSHSSVSDTVSESIEARNFPFLTWIYSDHQIKCDVVCVVVPMITGSVDIKHVLSDDGMTLFVEYIWPPILLNPHALFKNVKLEDGTRIPMEHAKVYAYQNRLLECELSNKSRPGASLVVPLPVRVQRELGTYRSQALECGDTEIAMIDFLAYQNKKVISDADNKITFRRHRQHE